MSDRIAVMEGGRLLQVGAPQEIYERPRTRFVADFIGDTNLLPATADASRDLARFADGTTVRVQHRAPAGTELTVAVRPEHVGLRPADSEPDPSLDALDGEVVLVSFLGNATLYEVATVGGGPRVRIRQGNAPGIEHFGVGDRVRVRWVPTSATVLDD